MPTAVPIIRTVNEGERRWFFGGGVHTWLVGAEETGGAFLLFEDLLTRDKMTPLHCHPDVDEMVYTSSRVRSGSGSVRANGSSAAAVRASPRVAPHTPSS